MGEDPDPNANALIEQLREEPKASIERRQKLEEESQATLARLKAESEASFEKLPKELESVRSNKKKRVKIDDIPQFTMVSSDESEGEDAGEGSRDDEEQSGGNSNPMAREVAVIKAQNRKMMKLLNCLPGAPIPVAYESRDGFAESPFVEEIAKSSWQQRRNNVNNISEPKAGESSSWPAIEYHLDINSYGFDTDIVGVVNSLKDIGQPLYLAFSTQAVNVVLGREAESQQLPVYYVSKTLLSAETRYSSLEKTSFGTDRS
uniref:Reverse transcriptase/retrotransposon-derived protein RNase H-like domain-containing protein n=1 Tax=Chenopodium quinoa TaxID=63459 RepID=A0A803MMZ7_CHEQI